MIHIPFPAPGPISQELFTRDQVAAQLGVTVRTLNRMVGRGEFPPPLKRNRRWARWYASDLAGYLNHLRDRRGGPPL